MTNSKFPNSILFYEGSDLFRTDNTDKNITSDFIQYVLSKQYEYRPTTLTLWAIAKINGEEVERYEYCPKNGLKVIIL
jgi:hypothetical protein